MEYIGYIFPPADCSLTMPDDTRKNIKVDPETFGKLKDDKGSNESWDDYLLSLHDDVPREARDVRIQDSQIQELAREIVNRMKSIR